MSRLLVLGNGFDLAHGYATRYVDFLSFCAYISSIPVDEKLQPVDKVVDVINIFIAEHDEKSKAKIISMIKGNLWIKRFINRISELKETWIDFEKEIQECCMKINNGDLINDTIEEFVDEETSEYDLQKIKEDFTDLIFLLKIYIRIASSISSNIYYKEILEFDPDMVINFNYSKTFNNYNANNLEVDYVHGIAESDDINNIVLGFDTMGGKEDDIEYAEF